MSRFYIVQNDGASRTLKINSLLGPVPTVNAVILVLSNRQWGQWEGVDYININSWK